MSHTTTEFGTSNVIHVSANANALNTEVLSDFGLAPSFYSCLAEIEKTAHIWGDMKITPVTDL